MYLLLYIFTKIKKIIILHKIEFKLFKKTSVKEKQTSLQS